jgi:hypothetical protein
METSVPLDSCSQTDRVICVQFCSDSTPTAGLRFVISLREVTTVSIVSLFPDTSKSGNTEQEDFEREVGARFRLVPNFFRSAPEAPLVIRELWLFAKSAYLDTPIPTLFKERLFVYLSRFCEMRYCITRHCGFLLGLGRSAGDPCAQPMTISQVIRLLQRPIPTEERTTAALARE